jgi:hypothetical protein
LRSQSPSKLKPDAAIMIVNAAAVDTGAVGLA